MILSDEPGYYEDGKFGIRIESLVKIVKAEPKYSSSGKKNKNNINFYLNDILDATAIVLHVLMIFTIIFDEASTLYFYGMMVDCLFVCYNSLFCLFVCVFVCCLFVWVFVCLGVCLFVCLFVCLNSLFCREEVPDV